MLSPHLSCGNYASFPWQDNLFINKLLRILISFPHLFIQYIYSAMCECKYMCAYAYTCTWRPEIGVACLPPSHSTLYVEADLSIKSRAHQFRQSPQLTCSREPCLWLLDAGITDMLHAHLAFLRVPGSWALILLLLRRALQPVSPLPSSYSVIRISIDIHLYTCQCWPRKLSQ